MAGMHRDKGGAATIAGLLQVGSTAIKSYKTCRVCKSHTAGNWNMSDFASLRGPIITQSA